MLTAKESADRELLCTRGRGGEPSPEPSLLRRLAPIARLVTRYFDAEVCGLDRIPRGPALLVGNHNAGLVSPEVYIFGWAYLEHTNYSDPPVALAHDMIFRTPLLGRWMRLLGAVPASRGRAADALARGRKVLVYPGGDWEATRPSRDRDRIDFGGRLGFLRLAWEAQVPIVPVVAAGAHDGWYVLTRGEKLARALHVRRLFRADVFPVALSLPWGLTIGAVLPHIPLPYKILIEALPPLPITGDPRSHADLRRGYAEVKREMQGALDRLVHRLPQRQR